MFIFTGCGYMFAPKYPDPVYTQRDPLISLRYEYQDIQINAPVQLVNTLPEAFQVYIYDRDNEVVDTNVLDGMRDKIADAISSLNEREMGVMEMRFGMTDGVRRTLEEVGDRFQVTRERIRQIEAKAIRKLTNPLRLQKLEMFNRS